MSTKEINDALSFVAMVCKDGYINGNYEETACFLHETFPNLPREIMEHIETLVRNL